MIVGGGAAGLAAALAASTVDGLKVTIVDDNPRLGGQIWRSELGKTKSSEARELIDSVTKGRIEIVNNAQIFASPDANSLLAETSDGPVRIKYKKLIIATGARERFLPFPGWTLPNVFGAGGLQALVKGGLKVENKRIVVSGTGPLLIAVAEYLRSKGALIEAVCEQAPAAKINKFALGLWRSPSKLAQAVALRRKLVGVPYLTDSWIRSANGSDRIESVTITRKGKSRMMECDMLACGFHLVGNTELASLLACRIENGFVVVDEFQKTTSENIFCAGEPTGIGGLESSLVEGKIAGFAAVGETMRARKLFGMRSKARKFGDSLNQAFALRDELRSLPEPGTVVCRCEDVVFGQLINFESWRSAKLQTRCGMGSCQGRICGAAVEYLFDWKVDQVRPPIFPVKLENL